MRGAGVWASWCLSLIRALDQSLSQGLCSMLFHWDDFTAADSVPEHHANHGGPHTRALQLISSCWGVVSFLMYRPGTQHSKGQVYNPKSQSQKVTKIRFKSLIPVSTSFPSLYMATQRCRVLLVRDILQCVVLYTLCNFTGPITFFILQKLSERWNIP